MWSGSRSVLGNVLNRFRSRCPSAGVPFSQLDPMPSFSAPMELFQNSEKL